MAQQNIDFNTEIFLATLRSITPKNFETPENVESQGVVDSMEIRN